MATATNKLDGLNLTQAGHDAVDYLSTLYRVERYSPADDVVRIGASVDDVKTMLLFVYGGKLLYNLCEAAGAKFAEIQFPSGLWVSITSWKGEPGCTMMVGHCECDPHDYARLRDCRERKTAVRRPVSGYRKLVEDIYAVTGEPVA